MNISEEDLVRFTSKIDYTDTCWLWTGYKDRDGYGIFCLNNRNMNAHRVALEIAQGRPLAPGMQAGHVAHAICGHRNCVNPEHLRERTHGQNMEDKLADGTCAKKLSVSDVLAIRADPRAQREIAQDYGISPSMVGLIKRGKNWSHVQ